MDQSAPASAPAMCTAGCGFFGNPATGGMCSKCARDGQQEVRRSVACTPPARTPTTAPPPETPPAASTTTATSPPRRRRVAEDGAIGTGTDAPHAASGRRSTAAEDTTTDASSDAAAANMPTAHARAAVEVATAMKAAAPEVANETKATEAPRSATTAASTSASTSSGTAACARATAGGRRVQKKKHRCWSCKAKVSLVEQEINKCLCGYVFCTKHRHAEDHVCDGDFVTRAREGIRARNEVVRADKLEHRI